MQKMGHGVGWDVGTMNGNQFIPGVNEADWLNAEFIPNVGNFTDNKWSFFLQLGGSLSFLEQLMLRFKEDMDLIGIDITPMILTWATWPLPIVLPEECHFAFLRRDPDYFDPLSMIDPLFNPESSFNIYSVNNAEINDTLLQSKAETDTFQRYEYYKKLQYLIHDKYYFHIPLFYDKIQFVHSVYLKNFPYNSMKYLFWYLTYQKT
jgi:ABC-type transport system substrate-binding protein